MITLSVIIVFVCVCAFADVNEHGRRNGNFTISDVVEFTDIVAFVCKQTELQTNAIFVHAMIAISLTAT